MSDPPSHFPPPPPMPLAPSTMVARTKEKTAPQPLSKLHALDITTGAERPSYSSSTIKATLPRERVLARRLNNFIALRTSQKKNQLRTRTDRAACLHRLGSHCRLRVRTRFGLHRATTARKPSPKPPPPKPPPPPPPQKTSLTTLRLAITPSEGIDVGIWQKRP